jgi:hypothetical protein
VARRVMTASPELDQVVDLEVLRVAELPLRGRNGGIGGTQLTLGS